MLAYCHQNNIKVVARGAGTSLSGGALPTEDAVVVGISRMNRVLEVDYVNRIARVEAGITNLGISEAVKARDFFYAPGSLEPARLHARRQHRHELGRRPLPQVRRHHQQRARPQDGADGRRDRRDRRRPSRFAGLRSARPHRSARRASSASSPRPPCASCARPKAARPDAARLQFERGRRPVRLRHHRRRHHPRRHRVHGPAPPSTSARRSPRPAIRMEVEALLIIEVEGSDEEIDRPAAPSSSRSPSRSHPRSIARQPERGAKRRHLEGPQGGIRRHRPHLRLLLHGRRHPARQAARGARRHRPDLRPGTACKVANIFHAGDGNLHPLILYDANDARRGASAPSWPAPRS